MKITGKQVLFGIVWCIVVISFIQTIADAVRHSTTQSNDVKHDIFDSATSVKNIEFNHKTSLDICGLKDIKKRDKPKCIADANDLYQRMLSDSNTKKETDNLIGTNFQWLLDDCRKHIFDKLWITRLDYINSEIWANIDRTITLRGFIGTTQGMGRFTCTWDAQNGNYITITTTDAIILDDPVGAR